MFFYLTKYDRNGENIEKNCKVCKYRANSSITLQTHIVGLYAGFQFTEGAPWKSNSDQSSLRTTILFVGKITQIT